MVSISDIVRQVEPVTGRMTIQMIDRFKTELLKVFRTTAAETIKSSLLKTYDRLAEIEESQMGARVRGKDPLSLRNLRSQFEAQITLELNNNVKILGDQLILQVMDKSKLGFGQQGQADRGTPSTADVLSYYLEGVIGDFAFITPQHYELRRNKPGTGLGRTGQGFLMARERYQKERWAEVTGIPFEDVRHAISGQPPFRGFRDAIQGIDFSPFIAQALETTKKAFDKLHIR